MAQQEIMATRIQLLYRMRPQECWMGTVAKSKTMQTLIEPLQSGVRHGPNTAV